MLTNYRLFRRFRQDDAMSEQPLEQGGSLTGDDTDKRPAGPTSYTQEEYNPPVYVDHPLHRLVDRVVAYDWRERARDTGRMLFVGAIGVCAVVGALFLLFIGVGFSGLLNDESKEALTVGDVTWKDGDTNSLWPQGVMYAYPVDDDVLEDSGIEEGSSLNGKEIVATIEEEFFSNEVFISEIEVVDDVIIAAENDTATEGPVMESNPDVQYYDDQTDQNYEGLPQYDASVRPDDPNIPGVPLYNVNGGYIGEGMPDCVNTFTSPTLGCPKG